MGGISKMVGNIFGGLFADEPAVPPPPPAIEPPPPMPLPDDEATAKVKRRSIAAQMARRGRASTIMSQSDPVTGGAASEPLGG